MQKVILKKASKPRALRIFLIPLGVIIWFSGWLLASEASNEKPARVFHKKPKKN